MEYTEDKNDPIVTKKKKSTTKDGITTTTTTTFTTPTVIDVDTKLKEVSNFTKPPTEVALGTPKEGGLDDFLSVSKLTIDDYILTPDKKQLVLDRVSAGMTLFEAITNVAVNDALKVLDLSKYDFAGGPGGIEYMDVDTLYMRKSIAKMQDSHKKTRYTKALNVLANAKNRGFKVIRSDDGRYWLESEEKGIKKYAINGLLEVKEVIDLVYGKAKEDTFVETDDTETDKGTDSTPKTTVTPQSISFIPQADYDAIEEGLTANLKGYTESEKWAMGSYIADAGTSLLGLVTKPAAGIGAIISFVGGIGSIAAEGYSDYLRGDSAADIAKNAGVGLFMEGMEAASFVPFSLIYKLRKGSKLFNILKKTLHIAMIGNLGFTVVDKQNKEIYDKLTSGGLEDLSLDDWRQITRLFTAAIAGIGIGRSHREARKGLSNAADKSLEGTPREHAKELVENSTRFQGVKVKVKQSVKEKLLKRDMATNKDALDSEIAEISLKKDGIKADVDKKVVVLEDEISAIALTKKKNKDGSFSKTKQNAKKNAAIKDKKQEIHLEKKKITEAEKAANIDIDDVHNKYKYDSYNNTENVNKGKRAANFEAEKATTQLVDHSKTRISLEQRNKEAKVIKGMGWSGGKKRINKVREAKGQRTLDDAASPAAKAMSQKIKAAEEKLELTKDNIKRTKKALKDRKLENSVRVKYQEDLRQYQVDKKVFSEDLDMVSKDAVKAGYGRLTQRGFGASAEAVVADAIERLAYTALPDDARTVVAALKSLKLSNASYMNRVGEYQKHKVYNTDDELNEYLVNVGYNRDLLNKLDIKNKQDLMRFVMYYKKARPPIMRRGGEISLIPRKTSRKVRMKKGGSIRLLVPRHVRKAATGFSFPEVKLPPGAIYVDQNGQVLQAGQTSEFFIVPDANTANGKPAMIFTINEDGTFLERGPTVIQGYVREVAPGAAGTSVNNVGDVVPGTTVDTKTTTTNGGNTTITYTPEQLAVMQKNYANSTLPYDPSMYMTRKKKVPPSIFNYVHPGDFIRRDKTFSESYILPNQIPTELSTEPLRTSPILTAALNSTFRMTNPDTADPFAANVIQNKQYSLKAKERERYVAKIAEEYQRQKLNARRGINAGEASVTETMNKNLAMQAQLIREQNATRLKSRKERYDYNTRKDEAIVTGLAEWATAKGQYIEGQKEDAEFNNLKQLISTYKTTYEGRILDLISQNKIEEADALKRDFELKFRVHPDKLIERISNVGNPYEYEEPKLVEKNKTSSGSGNGGNPGYISTHT